jgi:hypothetical protein
MRNTLVTMLVFLAGLAIGYFARSVGIGAHQTKGTHAAELTAIEMRPLTASICVSSCMPVNTWDSSSLTRA